MHSFSGLGKALVERLCKEGAVVFALDKEESLLADLKTQHPSISTVTVNLLQWDDTRNKIKAIINDQPVDCLINNAGMVMPESFLETREENIDM